MFSWFGKVSFVPYSKISDFAVHLKDGRMMGSVCKGCGYQTFPPRSDCPECMSPEYSFKEYNGKGEVYTFTKIDAAPTGFDDVVPRGMYAEQINAVISHLEAAIPFATPKMARALGALVQYYRTGSPIDFRAYNIAWVADDDSPVDTINGFIEVYVDPRGQKGAYEGIVYYDDPEKMDMIRKIAEDAQWFEDHMPFDPKYRKPEVKGISAKAIQVCFCLSAPPYHFKIGQ